MTMIIPKPTITAANPSIPSVAEKAMAVEITPPPARIGVPSGDMAFSSSLLARFINFQDWLTVRHEACPLPCGNRSRNQDSGSKFESRQRNAKHPPMSLPAAAMTTAIAKAKIVARLATAFWCPRHHRQSYS